MNKTVTIILCLLIMAAVPACGQSRNSSDYNYRKACEALYDDKDSEKALEYVNKQIEETPKHADSYYIRARIYYSVDKYDSSLRDLANALKFQNSKSRVYKSTIYGLRGKIYEEMDRDADAVLEYQMAVKYAKSDNKEQVQDYKFDLAQALYNSDQIDKSEAVYHDMLKDDPADCGAMVGLARICDKLERYDQGIEWCDKAESYDASYSQIYRIKMQLLDKIGKTDESVDAAIKYYETDTDAYLGQVAEYVGKHYTYGVAKTKAMINKHPGEYVWNFLLPQLYEDHCDYKKSYRAVQYRRKGVWRAPQSQFLEIKMLQGAWPV